MDRTPNGTHHFLLLTGSDYGPSLSTCAGDVAIRISGAPCAQLTMKQVGERRTYRPGTLPSLPLSVSYQTRFMPHLYSLS